MSRVLASLALLLLVFASTSAFADSRTLARDFADGDRLKFSTKGHPKAKNVHLTIAYPSSWRAAEGEGRNIVQKFVSEGGRGMEMAGIVVILNDLPIPTGMALSEQDQRDVRREVLSVAGLKEMLPPGATFIAAQTTSVERIPAGMLEYSMRAERVGIKMVMHVWSITFFSGNALVQVQFSVGGLSGSDAEVARRMAAFKPLFFLMANSIIFPDNITAPTPMAETALSSPPSVLELARLPDSAPFLIATLAVSFLVTWGLGLAPPLLIRYACLRRPLRAQAASWVAGGFCGFFWISFRLFHHAVGEKPGTGAVWLLVFVVARWILSRGSPAAATPAPQINAAIQR